MIFVKLDLFNIIYMILSCICVSESWALNVTKINFCSTNNRKDHAGISKRDRKMCKRIWELAKLTDIMKGIKIIEVVKGRTYASRQDGQKYHGVAAENQTETKKKILSQMEG